MDPLFYARLARSAETLRQRFESLRGGGPIPALMAEMPPGHPLPHSGDRQSPLPIASWPYPNPPCWIMAGMVAVGGRHTAGRDVWLGGGHSDTRALRAVCRDAGPFAPFIRRSYGLPEKCGSTDLEAAWIWTVFELAEKGVSGSLLRLDPNYVFRRCESCVEIMMPEWSVAEAESTPPAGEDFWSNVLRMKFDPTRYWQLEDLVEASIKTVVLAEVAIAGDAAAAAEPDQAIAPAQDKPAPRRRGETAAEILSRLWATTEGRNQIFAAGSADKIALMIGKSKSAVVEAGPIWDNKIGPALEAHRSYAQLRRNEERLRG